MGKPEGKPQIKTKTKIGLILAENKSTRNQFILKKIEEEMEKRKLQLVKGNSEFSIEKQESQIKKMIEEKVEIVVLQPLNDPTTKDQISLLVEKNIKIIILDFLPQNIPADAFIAPDYSVAGQLQAQYILDQANKVTPLIFKGDILNTKSEKTLEGNLNILQNSPLVENILIKEITENHKVMPYEIMVQEFSQQPPEVIIAHDEEVTLGLRKFIQEYKYENIIKLLSLEINSDLVEDILNGSLVVVDTMPNLLVQILVETINELRATQTWNYDFQTNNNLALIPTKLTPVRLIDKSNIKLLEERFPMLNKLKQEESKNKNGHSKNSPTEKQTKLKIKLKDGQEYEVNIPGEIEKMDIEQQK